FLAFLAVGGLLAWRWPRLVWLHLPAVGWGAAAVTAGIVCPLTELEKYLLRLAGEAVYEPGFIDHYLTDVLFPDSLTWLVRGLIAAAVVVGYAGLLLAANRRRNRQAPPVAATTSESTGRRQQTNRR
nr:DUF2784 domain-containing protein [Micromonospora sp. DSM 115978]